MTAVKNNWVFCGTTDQQLHIWKQIGHFIMICYQCVYTGHEPPPPLPPGKVKTARTPLYVVEITP